MFRLKASVIKHAKSANAMCRYATAVNKPAQKEDASLPPPPASSEFSGISDTSTSSSSLDYVVREPLMVKIDPLKPLAKEDASRKALTFDEIPGPRSLRFLAKIWNLLPAIGSQVIASTIQYLFSAGKLFGNHQMGLGRDMWFFRRILNEYGPIARLQGPVGGDVVVLFNTEDIGTVFSNEGRYPIRSTLDSLERYRLQYRRYKQTGPYLMYGPEWEHLRQLIEQPLQESVKQQFERIENTCDDFITRIEHIRNRHEETPSTFLQELHKWGLECLFTVTLNRSLGFLDPNGLSTTSEPAEILEALMKATKAINTCEFGLHFWKVIETPAWKALVRNCSQIDGIFATYIHKCQEVLRQKKAGDIAVIPEECSLIENLLLKEGILPEDILTVLLDMVLVGVNATSHSIAFLMYHLARSPKTQRKLLDEIKNFDKNFTKESLKSMRYLQACIKESLRLKPPLQILNRVLSKDMVIRNYHVPEGTHILIASKFSSIREENFEDPFRFKPERWLDIDSEDVNALASIPFGYGAKACFAKDLAEMEIALLTVKLIEKFKIEYHYGDIRSTSRLFAEPDRPLKFRIADRC